MNVAAAGTDQTASSERSLLQKLGRAARRQPLGAVSGALILLMAFVAIFADSSAVPIRYSL